MTINELYYLLLLLGGFGSFAVGLALAMLKYKAWVRKTAHNGRPAE
jgi:hypothetical protein